MAKQERTRFPKKKPGDSLSADHVNALSEACGLAVNEMTGTYQVGLNTGTARSTASPPFAVKHIVIVVSRVSQYLYNVRPRYYDHLDNTWKTNDRSGPYLMDSKDFEVDYKKDDKVVAYWDEQRAAFIPIGTTQKETPTEGEMWCAYICFWVPECCVYRVIVQRINLSEDYCEEIPTTREAGWVVHDLFQLITQEEWIDQGGTLEEYWCQIHPERMLNYGIWGWVRKISDEELECTYTPSGFEEEITETLPVYQWCWFPVSECPPKHSTITVKISSKDCEKANGIEVVLQWVEEIDGPPVNLADCTDAYEYQFANETPCVGFWVGEFEIETEHMVRLLACVFDKPDEKDVFGWIHAHWCTGALVQLYEVKDEFNEPVEYDGPYTNLRRLEPCRLLYTGTTEPTTGLPGPAIEQITYKYRIIVVCSLKNMQLSTPTICVERIWPDCHPWAGEALQDKAVGPEGKPICVSSMIANYDFDFGQSATRDGAVGWWLSGTEQAKDHRFAGCFDDLDENCDFVLGGPSRPLNYRWTMTLTW